MTTANFFNLRKSERLEAKGGIAVTPHGICQIINLNNDGVSFKCIKEFNFPIAWSMEIYDVKGQALEKLQVKKIWENWIRGSDNSSPFSVEVGGAFQNLSSSQKAQIRSYLQQLTGMEK